MKRNIFLLCALYSGLLLACNNDRDNDPSVYRKSYVNGFLSLSSELYAFNWAGVEVDEQNKTIDPWANMYEITSDAQGFLLLLNSRYIGVGKDKNQEFKQLIGDTHYNKKIFRKYPLYAVADTLSTITVTCNANYDDAHPAGSSLNDILAVYFNNPYRYIQNDYKMFRHGDEYLNLRQSFENDSWLMTGGKLTEIDFEANPFLGDELYFVLQQPPKQTGEYTFTFSVKKANGEVLTADAPAITLNAE